MKHNFIDSLEESKEDARADWWVDLYTKMYPELCEFKFVYDLSDQRSGLDRILVLPYGEIGVEEKVRKKAWNDIALEFLSSMEGKTPGWMEKDLICDLLVYVFEPTRVAYVFWWPALKNCWELKKEAWKKEYNEFIYAKNEGYTTVSVGVPINVIMKIPGTRRVEF